MESNGNYNGSQKTEDHHSPLDKLASSIDHLANKVDDFMVYSKNSVHIRVVILMFGILILSIVGVQGADFVFKQYLPKVFGISN